MKVLVLLLVLVMVYHPGYSFGHFPRHLTKRQSADNDSVVIGGSPVSIRKVPYVGHLNMSVGEKWEICGSSILTPETLLTAGHCLKRKPRVIRISIGNTDPRLGVYYYTSNYTWHSSYHPPKMDYDIGVVRSPVKLSLDGVVARAVHLPTAHTVLAAGTWLRVAGWGRMKEGENLMSDRLRIADLPVVSLEQCKTMFGAGAVTDRMLCAGELKKGGNNICYGDSGGPAAGKEDGVQYGITSGTSHCGADGLPSIFTDVGAPDLRDWIRREAHV